MAEGDVRGFYARLGVEIPDWAAVEAAVSCFADPEAHKRSLPPASAWRGARKDRARTVYAAVTSTVPAP
jgi:hypothetical protein